MRRVGPFLVLIAACSGEDDRPSGSRDAGSEVIPRDGGRGAGQLAVTPTSLDFGDVVFGDAVSETVLLMNTGDATVTVREVDQRDPFDPSYSTSTPRQTIPPNVSVGLIVTFRPAGVGLRETVLVVETTAGDVELPVRGVGLANPCRTSTTGLDFRRVIARSTKEIIFEVTNPNVVDVTATLADRTDVVPCDATGPIPEGFCIYGGDRMIGQTGEFVLSANETTQLIARYTPATSTTTDSGSFTLRCFGEADGGPTVTLDGRGVATGFECPLAVDFGVVALGDCLTTTATCTNEANLPVIVAGWDITPPMNADFTPELSETLTLEADEVLGIDLTYCPATIGPHTGSLDITTDHMNPVFRIVAVPLGGMAQ